MYSSNISNFDTCRIRGLVPFLPDLSEEVTEQVGHVSVNFMRVAPSKVWSKLFICAAEQFLQHKI